MSAGSRRNCSKLSKPMNSASNSVQRVRLNQNDSSRGQHEDDAEDDDRGQVEA